MKLTPAPTLEELEGMWCISLWQCWASLWCAGLKLHETRSWYTNVRGRVTIHAAKVRDAEGQDIYDLVQSLGFLHGLPLPGDFYSLPFGAIVGTVDIVACLPTNTVYPEPREEADYLLGDYGPRRWAWKAENPVLFDEPIPYRGSQGFFRLKFKEPAAPVVHVPDPQGVLTF